MFMWGGVLTQNADSDTALLKTSKCFFKSCHQKVFIMYIKSYNDNLKDCLEVKEVLHQLT